MLLSAEPAVFRFHMNLRINGQVVSVKEGSSVASLLEARKLKPATVVVEYNQAILPRDLWSDTVLKSDDSLEIVTFVGGG